jgi:hypothetical protein
MFASRAMWKIFGQKRGEVTKGRKNLHNEKLNDLFSLPYIIRVIK